MNNFQKASIESCQNRADELREWYEPNYSKNHLRKMNSIMNGKKIGNMYMQRTTLRLAVACILIFALNIVAFAYIDSQTRSKEMYLRPNGSFGGIDLAVKNPNWEYDSISDIKCEYIPDGFKEIDFICNKWDDAYGNCVCHQREFEKGGERFGIIKLIEANERIAVYHGIIGEIDDSILPSIDEVEVSMEKIKKNGIYYYVINNRGVYWNCDGCIYFVYGNISNEALFKIAENAE